MEWMGIKRFNNRETIAALNYETQQMSFIRTGGIPSMQHK